MEDNRDGKTWTKAERWETSDEDCDFLYGLVRAVKPELVLDLGTYKGKSLIAMAKAVQENGSGALIGVDKDDHSDWVVKECNREGLTVPMVVFRGRSPEVLEELDLEGLEFAFLDTDHTYDTVLGELEAVDRHLKISGYIAVHDSLYPEHSEQVLRACFKFLEEHPNYWAVNIESYAGVVFMQKCLAGELLPWRSVRFAEEVTSDGVE